MMPGAAPGMLIPVSIAQVSQAAVAVSGAPTAVNASRPLFPSAAAQVS